MSSRKCLRYSTVALKGMGMDEAPRKRRRKVPSQATPAKQLQSSSCESSVWFAVMGSSPEGHDRSEQSFLDAQSSS